MLRRNIVCGELLNALFCPVCDGVLLQDDVVLTSVFCPYCNKKYLLERLPVDGRNKKK